MEKTPVTEPVRQAAGAVLGAFLADAALIVVFAAIGRASHDEGAFSIGLAQTAWPFLVALALGWLLTLAWRRPLAPLRTGIGVWAVTLAGGMILRFFSGQGVAIAFIIVAAITLLVFVVGWRAAVAGVRRLRRRGR